VDDDEDVRQVSVAMLRELGYRVHVASNGQEALSFLQKPDRIDLLVTDLVMPGGISGTALARRARLIRPSLKVLLATGYAGMEPTEAEGFPIIYKPFRPTELGGMIAELLGSEKRS
jgi:CheY-like chemotaxis protein